MERICLLALVIIVITLGTLCILSETLITCNCGMNVLFDCQAVHCSQALSVHNVLLLVRFTVQTDKDIARLSAIVADSKPAAQKLAQRVQQLLAQS